MFMLVQKMKFGLPVAYHGVITNIVYTLVS